MRFKKIIKKILPYSLLHLYHFKMALLGAMFYRFPGKSKKIKIIGVTGTSGKSTVVDLTAKILEESGNKVASISTIRFKLGQKEWANRYKMTMPGRFVIQKFLRQAINANCDYVFLEVTSEGIRQFRHKFINFHSAVFNNLTPEHIESHGSFENYRNEKLKLFKVARNNHIVNIDDANAKYFLISEAKKKYGFTIKNKIDNSLKVLKAHNIRKREDGISFDVDDVKFNLSLYGEFNVSNALASISIASAEGIGLSTSKSAIEKVKIEGRMEVVANSPISIIVDYAHTPEQLEAVYKTLNHKPLICVLGSCGGGRDKWKRPVLGGLARQYCKQVIITNEDPYDEDPKEIIDQVAVSAGSLAKKIIDRKEAIGEAIKIAEPGDAVIITGKGCEPWMCLENGKKIPWDDRKIAKEELEKIKDKFNMNL